MEYLQSRITDAGFTKLSAPSSLGRAGRATKAVAKGITRGVRRAGASAAHRVDELADAGSSAGVDGVLRMVEGEAANRGIEAGGGALTNYGNRGATAASAGTVVPQTVRPSSPRAAARRIATKGPARSVGGPRCL